MLYNGQTYFKDLAVFTPQDFKSMFSHFTTLCMKGLTRLTGVTHTKQTVDGKTDKHAALKSSYEYQVI